LHIYVLARSYVHDTPLDYLRHQSYSVTIAGGQTPKKQGGLTMKLEFNLQGAERKNLVKALEGILETKAVYLKTPSLAFQIGEYHLDKFGTLTGEDNFPLVGHLMKNGFKPDNFEYDTDLETATEAQETATDETETIEEHEPETEPTKPQEADTGEETSLTIEIPLGKFTPEKLENLCRLVSAKETLIKAALGVDAIPIQVTDEKTIKFPWHRSAEAPTGEEAEALANFITLLAETALEKKRVTATDKGLPENPKYAMRCFLLSIGMIGREYLNSRRYLLSRLEGDSSWKGGKPPKAEAPPAAEPKSALEMIMEQLPEGAEIIRTYNASESGEMRVIINEDGEKRYAINYEKNGYPRLIHKP
jgi:hypothetical protein